MECWSDGVVECWSVGAMRREGRGVMVCWSDGVMNPARPVTQYSNTPSLQHSIPPYLLPLLLVLLLAPAEAQTPAAALVVTSPVAGAEVRGTVNFGVRASNLPGLACVEYRLNDQPLSGALTAAPYAFSWHTALIWDGQSSVQAVARDSNGAVLAESAPVAFRVRNGTGRMELAAPDLRQPVRGKVRFSVRGDWGLPEETEAKQRAAGRPRTPFEAVLFFIDGHQVGVERGGSTHPVASVDIETTRLTNGRHQFFAAAYGASPDVPPAAMLSARFTVDNGRAVRAVRPRWRELFLMPGEKVNLGLTRSFTDGAEEAVSTNLTFSSGDRNVATVDASGVVTAVNPGLTTIALRGRDGTARTRVRVEKAFALPHFARDGEILQSYDPVRSLFVRSLFNLAPSEIERTPGLAEQARAAGINALTSGFFVNPGDGKRFDFAAWKRAWEPFWSRIESVARQHGFSLVLTGDDLARNTHELTGSLLLPWSREAVKLAVTRARDSRRVVCIEMVDEVSMIWGETPRPADDRWKKRDPRLTNDAFAQLMESIDAVPGRPPVSWPVIGLAGPETAGNWMGDPRFSDYASNFWTYMDFRRAYPHGASLPQDRAAMDRVTLERQPRLQRDRPVLLLTGIAGGIYTRRGTTPDFTPGVDELNVPGYPPVSVAAQVMYAAAAGSAGVRAYAYDAWWADDRRKAPPGTAVNLGAGPFTAGSDRWQALASAFNLLKRLEPDLLQPPTHALDLGDTFVTGARQGARGRLFMAVNFTDAPEPARLDLSAYQYSGGPPAFRYRLRGASLTAELMAATVTSDAQTIAPGEAVVWLFRPASPATADAIPPTISLQWPPPDASVTGRVTVRAAAADATGVDRVEFFLDGTRLGEDREAPYSVVWESDRARPALWHGLSAIAFDRQGNASEARTAVKTGSRG